MRNVPKTMRAAHLHLPGDWLGPIAEGVDTGSNALFGVGGLGPDRSKCLQRLQRYSDQSANFDYGFPATSGMITSGYGQPESSRNAASEIQALLACLVAYSLVNGSVADLEGEISRPIQLDQFNTLREYRNWQQAIAERNVRQTWCSQELGSPEGGGDVRWVAELQKLEGLKVGWNGYGAPSPERMAIEVAKVYLQASGQEDFEPNRVEASVMGGVGITHRRGNRKVYVEFYNNGSAHSLLSERGANMQTMAINPVFEEFRRFVMRAKEYLNGRSPTGNDDPRTRA